MASFKKVLRGVEPGIYHRFQDISNEMIVTLIYSLSGSCKMKPMGSVYIISVGPDIVNVAVVDIFHVKKYDLDF